LIFWFRRRKKEGSRVLNIKGLVEEKETKKNIYDGRGCAASYKF